jgi:hypothetical protein
MKKSQAKEFDAESVTDQVNFSLYLGLCLHAVR